MLYREPYKRLLVEYKDDPLITKVFMGFPYITQHMNAKDRNDYNSFRKGKDKKVIIPPPPMGFSVFPPPPAMQQINFMPGRPPMGGFYPSPPPMP